MSDLQRLKSIVQKEKVLILTSSFIHGATVEPALAAIEQELTPVCRSCVG